MKKVCGFITLLVISAFLLNSCYDDVSRGREIYKAYFKHVLEDPSSFTVYSEKYDEKNSGEVDWILDYGARNSLGGMVRETKEFKTIGTTIFIDDTFWNSKMQNN